ncbi:MAG: sigma-E factor negative regulatory protein [Nitrosospira sp.]|nr:sigma-E factor negative regulatory protein [Nitrosospira sp.]
MKDEISALMDGELDAGDAAGVITQLKKTDELSDAWTVYHLISDALGQSEVRPANIARHVSARLASEPTVLAPRPLVRRKSRAFAVAASITAAAVIGWMNVQTTDRPPATLAANQQTPQSTPKPALPAVSVASVAAPAPEQINDYLLAHRQFSPSTAMHGVAPYMMRTVAESRENTAR